jgi:hypothetical protein
VVVVTTVEETEVRVETIESRTLGQEEVEGVKE